MAEISASVYTKRFERTCKPDYSAEAIAHFEQLSRRESEFPCNPEAP